MVRFRFRKGRWQSITRRKLLKRGRNYSRMTHAKLFSVLLIAAICLPFLPVSNVSSQMNRTVTTTTIKVPQTGQCAILAIPFSAPARSAVTGEFTADVVLDFYILTQNDYSAFTQSGGCAPARAKPLFKLIDQGGSHNQYNSAIFSDGIYLFLFVYRVGVFSIATGYGTVRLSFPPSITFIPLDTLAPPVTSTSTTTKNV